MESSLYTINDIIRNTVESLLMDVHTSIPAIVESYDSSKQTIAVKIAVNRPTYKGANITAGRYKDIPVVFPAGQDWVIAGPLGKGDVVQLIVPHYGTEDYMAGSREKVGDAKHVKRHDLNDAIAIPGMFTSNSVTRKNAHKDTFHLANGDSSVIVIEKASIKIQVGSSVFEVTSSGITMTGNLTVNGAIQGTTVGTPTVNLTTHVHNYVDNPSGAVVATAIGVG